MKGLNPFRRSVVPAQTLRVQVDCRSRDGVDLTAGFDLGYRLFKAKPQSTGLPYLDGVLRRSLREQIACLQADAAVEAFPHIVAVAVRDATLEAVGRVQVLEASAPYLEDRLGGIDLLRAKEEALSLAETPLLPTPRGRLSGLSSLERCAA